MANKLFQLARNAVQNVMGRNQEHDHEAAKNKDSFDSLESSSQEQHGQMSDQSMEIAQNAISSAMANSSDAERAQLAELQSELDSSASSSVTDKQS